MTDHFKICIKRETWAPLFIFLGSVNNRQNAPRQFLRCRGFAQVATRFAYSME